MKTCIISQKQYSDKDLISGSSIRKTIFDFIKIDHPNLAPTDSISLEILHTFRRKYILTLLENDQKDQELISKKAAKIFEQNPILKENIVEKKLQSLSFGDRMADRIASFGGSWTFIISFFSFIMIWILVNTYVLISRPFDTFPFILLNLILSCLAAIQAPIIMMSQNRQEEKDRFRAEQDFRINKKAELEVKMLSDKIDHLFSKQSNRLFEIQELQLDYLEEIIRKKSV